MKNFLNNNSRKITVIISLIFLTLFIVLPLVVISTYNLYSNDASSFKTLFTKDIAHIYFNTLKLGILVILVSSVISFPLAFINVKTNLRFKVSIDILSFIPVMIPPYIESMGWILFLQKKGYLDTLCPALSFLRNYFFSLTGLVIIMSLHVFPFMYLGLKNTLLKVSSNLEDAAFVHGSSLFFTLRKIIFPLLLSSYMVGALLIFLRTVSEFGVPATFGRKIGYYVLTTEIYKYVSDWPIDFGKASTLSLLLTLSCLILWFFQNHISLKHSYLLIGGKSSKKNLHNLNILAKVIVYMYIFLVFTLAILVPIISIFFTSIIKVQGYGLSCRNFTLINYINIFSSGSDGFNALINTFKISILASILTTIIGTFYGLIIGKYKKGLLYKLTAIFSILPNTVPGIVIIIGLILVFNSKYMPLPIYNTFGMVILTYVVLFLPYTVEYVSNSYSQINSNLEEAANLFGSKYLFMLKKIIIPLNSKAIFSGFIMTFIVSVRELVAPLMILPPSMQNSASFIYSQFEQGSEGAGMAMALVSIIITAILLIILNMLSGVKKERT